MKHFPISAILLLVLAGTVAADVPKNPSLSSYQKLWTDSPFTSKPPPPEPGPPNNPLDDYALIGVSPIGGNRYRVTLINKKQPEDRIMVESGPGRDGFKVLGVIPKAGDPLGTIVQMSSGSMTGTVAFDEKLLALAAPPAAARPGAPNVPGRPPIPGMVQPTNGGQPRAVRPRVVPPPVPQGAQQQPQAQPQVQHQGQQQTQGNRGIRRRRN